MQVKPPGPSGHIDRYLIASSLVGFAAFLSLLTNDSWLFENNSDGEKVKIGAVEESELDVRRRSRNDFIWLPIEKSLPVYEGDSIFTGSKSKASIMLDSGVKLTVNPDSLVVLEKTADTMKLDLKFGQLKGTLAEGKGSTVKIKISEKDLALAGSSVEFDMEKVKAKETKLRVVKGTAQIVDTATKKEIKVEEKQQVKLTESTPTAPAELQVNVAPDFINVSEWGMPRNLWLPKRQALRFAWEAEGEVDYYDFILSTKPDLSSVLVRQKVKSMFFVWMPDKDKGELYWQVRAVNQARKHNIHSEIINWKYNVLTAPQWIGVQQTLDITKIELWEAKSGSSEEAFVSWDMPIPASQMRLEWSREESFGKVESQEFMDSRWKLPKWETGSYYLRVRSEALGRPPSLWSRTLHVRVNDLDPDGLSVPEIRLSEVETEANKGKPQIDWGRQPKTSDYIVELSDKNDFSSLLDTQKVAKNVWTGDPRAQGTYYLRVYPLSVKGRRGPVSKTVTWIARAEPPQWKLKSPVLEVMIPRDQYNRTLPFPETLLQWEQVGLVQPQAYWIEQDQQPDFKAKKAIKVEKPEFLLKDLEPGEYFYRVRSAFPGGGFSMVSVTLVLKVTQQNADGLPEPVLLTQRVESPLTLEETASTRIKWKKMPEANEFVVQVSDDPTFKKPVIDTRVTQHQVDLSIDEQSDYLVRVAGISAKGNQGPWSSLATWRVFLGPPIVQPMEKIVKEAAGPKAPVPLTPLKVEWKAHKSLKRFELQIAEDAAFNQLLVQQKLEGNSYVYNLPKGGKYRIRVRGMDQAGKAITPFSQLEEVVFVLKRPLIAPVLLFPKNKISYILAKMKTSELWLEWENQDPSATSFQIEFSKDSDFKEVKYTRASKSSKLLLDHKTIKGKLYWRVKALNEDQELSSPWSEAWSLSVVDILSED